MGKDRQRRNREPTDKEIRDSIRRLKLGGEITVEKHKAWLSRQRKKDD